jgi:transmembrane sensor
MDSSLDSSDSLADRAEAWVILLHSGHATDKDRRELAAWRAESVDHERAFRTAERLWRDMGLALQPAAVNSRRAPASLIKKRHHNRSAALAIAACVLISVITVRMLGLTDIWLSDYHTAMGERSEITLADGSRVTLDTDTALSVHFGENVRRVELQRGRASFKVAPDPRHPFEVAGGAVTARALGTAYDVAVSGSEVRVSVLEHSVAVRASGSDRELTLAAGQQAYWDGRELKGPEPADLRAAAAWRRGKLIFENRTLAEAVAELDRYRPGAILMTSAELRALRVTGVFPLDQPDSVLNDMAGTLKLRTTKLGPWVTLLHR